MEPLALCVGMEKAKQVRIGMLAAGMGVRLAEVLPCRQGLTLGVLCGVDPDCGRDRPGHVPGEMLVMAHFPPGLDDRFLRALRDSGCAVPLKAFLTPYNRFWPCDKLYRELQLEAAAFADRRGGAAQNGRG